MPKKLTLPFSFCLQINICGPPHCCSGIDLVSAVDFNLVCDLESHQCKNLTEKSDSVESTGKRTDIYYCVSPTLRQELQGSDSCKDVQRYAKVETVIDAHLMKKNRLLSDSCRKDSKYVVLLLLIYWVSNIPRAWGPPKA